MEILGTVVIIEPLRRVGNQGLDMFPYPLGPSTDDAQAHLLFRNHAALFDLRAGRAEVRLVLDLMPTAPMDDALAIPQRETKTLGVTPLPPPPSAPGALAPLPCAWLGGTVRPCRHIRAINPQDQHGAAVASGCDGGDAWLALVAWRGDIENPQPPRSWGGAPGPPLTPPPD